MGKLIISGQNKLSGEISVYGAKNAVLPIIAASVLNGRQNVIRNCPNILDVKSAFRILKNLGCKVNYDGKVATIDSYGMNDFCVQEKLMREMRSSVIFLGAIVSRCREAIISYPGGCELGPRPIDIHLKAFRQLGVEVEESHGYIYCKLDKLKPQNINLSFPSVGATENIMLLTAISDGETTITNAAREPEIIDLASFLNSMGANVEGAGSEVIAIKGVKRLNDADYIVMPDRIVAATYLCAAAISGGEIVVKNINPSHCQSVISTLKEAGCTIRQHKDSVKLKCAKRLSNVDNIKTMPYPGFPTDVQAIMMAILARAHGTSVFVENMFENRYKHVQELTRMGADITVNGRVAVVQGVSEMLGASVKAEDLRGGASLIVAGLGASGITEVSGLNHIDRGYEKIEDELSSLGADIYRVEDETK